MREVVRAFFQPIERSLDYLFYAGVTVGLKSCARCLVDCWGGIRTYVMPLLWTFGKEKKLSSKYGKWAVITGGTTPLGLAYAHEVSTWRVTNHGG